MRLAAVEPALAGAARLTRVVESARRHLDMDAVCLSEFVGGRQVTRAVAGDAASFGLLIGTGPRLIETYCQRMVEGTIPTVIPDTTAEPRVRGLAVTSRVEIGAYVGTPIRLAGRPPYGTLFALNHTPRPALDGDSVRVLSALADVIADDLGEERDVADHRGSVSRVIAAGGVQIACQPVVDLRDGAVLGVEALARFPADEPPDAVFAAAHAAGTGVGLERAVIRKALGVLPRLARQQFLSVNVSPSAALAVVGDADGAGSARVPMDRLVVEITEHAAVSGYAELRRELAEPRRRGLRIAIDDAGAGYASLRHVIELQPDFIKIDRSLVSGLAHDHARRIAVSSFVLLALDLGATVIAEGVETTDDLSALVDLGVDAAQGYLLDRPSTSTQRLDYWTRTPGCTEPVRRRSLPAAPVAGAYPH